MFELVGRDDPRTDAAGTDEVFALGNIEFRVADPVAQRALVQQGEARDMFERVAFGNPVAGFADDDCDLAFVVELCRLRGAPQRGVVAGERIDRAHEQTRPLRFVGAVLVLCVTVRVVHADAGDLFRAIDW